MPLGQQWQMTTSTPDLMPVSRVGPDILTYAQLDVSMTAAADQETSAMGYSPASIAVDRASPVPLYYQVAQELERAIESGELKPGTRLDNEIALADHLGLSRPTMRRAIEYLVQRGLLVRKRGVGTQVVHPKVRRPLELTSLYDDLAGAGKRPATRVLSLEVVPAPDAVAHEFGLPEGTPVLTLERIRFAQDEPLTMQRTAFDDTGRAVEYGSHLYRASIYSFEFVLTSR